MNVNDVQERVFESHSTVHDSQLVLYAGQMIVSGGQVAVHRVQGRLLACPWARNIGQASVNDLQASVNGLQTTVYGCQDSVHRVQVYHTGVHSDRNRIRSTRVGRASW